MPIQYFICQDPPRRDGKPAARHLQVKNLTPATNEDVAERIQSLNNLLDIGTSTAVLLDLRRALAELLSEGNSVHLSGIGTFTPKVSGKIGKAKAGVLRSRVDNPQVVGLDFQLDASFLDAINRGARFEHIPEPRAGVNDEELRNAVAQHFAAHDALTTGELSQLLHISKDRARTYLNKLVTDGILRKEGVRAMTKYVRISSSEHSRHD